MENTLQNNRNEHPSTYIEDFVQKASAHIGIEKYLLELSVKAKHSSDAIVSVSSVIDKLLDIRNSLPDIIFDGDELTKTKGLELENS